MKEYNIAQIGAFDYENIGDLLFTDVLKKQLEKRIKIKNHFLFACNGKVKPLDENNSIVYSVDRLEELHLANGIDAIIIGGGDLIRFDSAIAPEDNYSSKNSTFDLIFYPAYVASKYNIPLLWNCPGVPLEFSPSDGLMLKNLLDHVDLITVRDECSKKYILDAVPDGKVTVSPDTVLSMCRFFDLKPVFSALCQRFPFLQKEYVVFQSFPAHQANVKDYHLNLCKQLTEISQSHTVILLPIGKIHHDDTYLAQLKNEIFSDNVILLNDALNVFEASAIIANAKAFSGTSLHGNIIANSYNVPSIILDVIGFVKTKGYFALTGRSPYCVSDVSQLASVFNKLLQQPMLDNIDNCIKQIDRHFDVMAEAICSGRHKKTDFLPLLEACYKHSFQRKNVFKITFDTPQGSVTHSDTFFGTGKAENITLPIPEATAGIKISPCENALCRIDNINITVDGTPTDFTHNGYIFNEGEIFFGSPDQAIVLENVNGKLLEVSLNINVIPRDDAHYKTYDDAFLCIDGLRLQLKEARLNKPSFATKVKSKLKRILKP